MRFLFKGANPHRADLRIVKEFEDYVAADRFAERHGLVLWTEDDLVDDRLAERQRLHDLQVEAQVTALRVRERSQDIAALEYGLVAP